MKSISPVSEGDLPAPASCGEGTMSLARKEVNHVLSAGPGSPPTSSSTKGSALKPRLCPVMLRGLQSQQART